jgi:nucleoside phosphorylase
MPDTVGIVVALASEARALAQRTVPVRAVTTLDDRSLIWLSGMGQDAAREGALALIAAGANALLSFGVAGGLAPGLRSGTLVCPSCVLDERSHDYQPDPGWRMALMERLTRANLRVAGAGSLLSLPKPLLGSTDKGAMRERHQSLAVDMESAAVAAVATEHGLPFLVLRAIVDEREDNVPFELQAGVDDWGRPQMGRMIVTLLRRPRLLVQLPGLATRMGNATAALRAATKAAGAEWGRPAAQPVTL